MDLTAGTVPSLDGSEGWSFPTETLSEPDATVLPMPVFARRHQRGLHRTAAMATATQEQAGGTADSGGESAEFYSSSSGPSGSAVPKQQPKKVRISENMVTESDQSSISEVSSSTPQGGGEPDDPWMTSDPWQQRPSTDRQWWPSYAAENYEEQSMHESDSMSGRSSEQSVHESDRMSWRSGGSGYGEAWSEGAQGNYEPNEKWENWSDGSHWSWRSSESWSESAGRDSRYGSAHSGYSNWTSDYGSDWYKPYRPRWDELMASENSWTSYSGGLHHGHRGGDRECGGEHSNPSSSGYQTPMEDAQPCPQTPISPQMPRDADGGNLPSGKVPSGNPSIAGGSGQEKSESAPSHGKIPSSYPPIFYARPGESWEEYWRSVTFWVA